jgi:molybdopterin converting factor small subunit
MPAIESSNVIRTNENSRALVHPSTKHSEPSASITKTSITSEQAKFADENREKIDTIKTTLNKLNADLKAGNPRLLKAHEDEDYAPGSTYSHRKLDFEMNGHKYFAKKLDDSNFEIRREPMDDILKDGKWVDLLPSEHGKLCLATKDHGSKYFIEGVHMTDVFDGQKDAILLASKSELPPKLILEMKNFEIQLLSKLLGNRIE